MACDGQVQVASDDAAGAAPRALKLDTSEHASGAWEFYALHAMAGRARADERGLFAAPEALVLAARGSALLLPLGGRGTLQALLNAHMAAGQVHFWSPPWDSLQIWLLLLWGVHGMLQALRQRTPCGCRPANAIGHSTRT